MTEFSAGLQTQIQSFVTENMGSYAALLDKHAEWATAEFPVRFKVLCLKKL
jgi:hypothetical protein